VLFLEVEDGAGAMMAARARVALALALRALVCAGWWWSRVSLLGAVDGFAGSRPAEVMSKCAHAASQRLWGGPLPQWHLT
jgi:hypothetical protein